MTEKKIENGSRIRLLKDFNSPLQLRKGDILTVVSPNERGQILTVDRTSKAKDQYLLDFDKQGIAWELERKN